MPNLLAPYDERKIDPRIRELAPYFDYEHLHPDVRPFSQQCYDLAANMISDLKDGPAYDELYYGLRKLLEAKDCFVRASIARWDKDEETEEEVVARLERQAAQVADDLQVARKAAIAKQSADVDQYFDGEPEPGDA